MALSPQFLARLEENMRVISEDHYTSALKNQWWSRVAREMSSTLSKEHLFFLISGGALDYGTEGNTSFLEQSVSRIDLEPKFIDVPGLRLLKSELDDSDGAGLQKASQWSAKVAKQAALFPQQKLAQSIIANPTAYDGGVFFRTTHPVHPGDPNVGTFANDFTSSASGAYPGALPITGTFDTANANIGKAIAYIRSIKAPDGVSSMNLEPKYILVPPTLHRPAIIATQARFIGGSIGSTDVSQVVSDFNLEIIMAPELAGDASYYIGCEAVGTEIGAFVYLNREPCTVTYHGPMTSAELARKRVFEWIMNGRAVVGPGRPEFLFRCQAT